MHYSKRTIAAIITLLTITFGAACTPEQVALYESLPSHKQEAVLAHLASNNSSKDCYEAIDKHFSGDKERMKRIVRRESGNNPAAANKSSSASSCAQLLFSLHGWRYEAVGCSKAQRYDADCNIKAADHLYREQGWRPWKLTDY